MGQVTLKYVQGVVGYPEAGDVVTVEETDQTRAHVDLGLAVVVDDTAATPAAASVDASGEQAGGTLDPSDEGEEPEAPNPLENPPGDGADVAEGHAPATGDEAADEKPAAKPRTRRAKSS